ncbi:tRNA pseudouridine(55) synthase TruB [bacterium]|nr:tRNA pseudouridine(55) synthase TruB [bacterium]NIN93038.1 tRNA pseudouridine(55) synthase TruB [bacterium]NIO18907.1 tRNA pseudouridine(55) synthase TruB [bacterium]NIO73988.1 tRNA pseudouridine(55) synthase TruB [bacterium]
MTSFAVVQEVKAFLSAKKAGHAGTLDPQAKGVLLILLGEATKISTYLMRLEKEYEATMVLGISTSTQDGQGEILKKIEPKVVLRELNEVFDKFLGAQKQIPPMVSAKRYRGRRLYQLFREGSVVERTPQKVEIRKLELLSYDMPEVKFRTICSSGTYVRTLCHDMGEALGCGAHMSRLVRLRVGNFRLSDAISWERKQLFHQKIQSISEALSDLPNVIVTRGMGQGIRMGRQIKDSEVINVSLSSSEIADNHETFKISDEDGNLIALAKGKATFGEREFELLRVFNPGI